MDPNGRDGTVDRSISLQEEKKRELGTGFPSSAEYLFASVELLARIVGQFARQETEFGYGKRSLLFFIRSYVSFTVDPEAFDGSSRNSRAYRRFSRGSDKGHVVLLAVNEPEECAVVFTRAKRLNCSRKLDRGRNTGAWDLVPLRAIAFGKGDTERGL